MTPDPKEVESIKRAARSLHDAIVAAGIEMEPEFMDVLRKLMKNPVREGVE